MLIQRKQWEKKTWITYVLQAIKLDPNEICEMQNRLGHSVWNKKTKTFFIIVVEK